MTDHQMTTRETPSSSDFGAILTQVEELLTIVSVRAEGMGSCGECCRTTYEGHLPSCWAGRLLPLVEGLRDEFHADFARFLATPNERQPESWQPDRDGAERAEASLRSTGQKPVFDWRERVGRIIDHAHRLGDAGVKEAVIALLYEYDTLPLPEPPKPQDG